MRVIITWTVVLATAALGQVVPGTTQGKMEPAHVSGQGITPAFEGWYRNPDGTANILVGYYNRNTKETMDIPVGPNNRVEPGGPDQGQPTHFLTGRQWGVFTVTVPADYGTKKLTWTITANHLTTIIAAKIDPLWEISPFSEAGMGNTPPSLRLAEGGPSVQGPAEGPRQF